METLDDRIREIQARLDAQYASRLITEINYRD